MGTLVDELVEAAQLNLDRARDRETYVRAATLLSLSLRVRERLETRAGSSPA